VRDQVPKVADIMALADQQNFFFSSYDTLFRTEHCITVIMLMALNDINGIL
jgi:hypothetical protein